jgi:hypothetical protein
MNTPEKQMQLQIAMNLIPYLEKLPSQLQLAVFDVIHDSLKPPSVIRTIEL